MHLPAATVGAPTTIPAGDPTTPSTDLHNGGEGDLIGAPTLVHPSTTHKTTLPRSTVPARLVGVQVGLSVARLSTVVDPNPVVSPPSELFCMLV